MMEKQHLNSDFGKFSNNTFKKIGQLKHMTSDSIKSSGVSIGFECLDRFMFDPEKCYDKLAAIGVKWARCQTGWCRCEKEKGVYDFQWLDDIVDNLLKRGVQPWFNVGYGNKLYMSDAYGDAAVGHVPLYYGKEVFDAWINYVSALAEHFWDRVKIWEIWNEANIKVFWQPMGADPLEYARLVGATAKPIRRLIPDAKIAACTSVVFDPEYSASFFRSGIAKQLDIFGIHTYGIIPERKNFYAQLAVLKRIIKENDGEHISVIQGESGYASWFPENHGIQPYIMESQTNQAKWLLRRYITDFGAGLEMSSYFQMADMVKPYKKGTDEIKSPARHGILDGFTYEPKESYHALGNIAALFDCDTHLRALFMDIYTDEELPRREGGSRLIETSLVMHSFIRHGYPVYVYYLPEDAQHVWKGLNKCEIRLMPDEIDKGISEPVLVDMLNSEVYNVNEFDINRGYVSKLRNMPLKDYPLLLTDIKALSGRIKNNYCKGTV
jgi:polysaccharide biosynthesis protein PslG